MHAPALPPGLIAVTGDERSGKTSWLRRLCGELPARLGDPSVQGRDVLWLDLGLPAHDDQTPVHVWGTLQTRCPRWNSDLQQDLMDALNLRPHLDKTLSMLSAGTRRKVALLGLLASGASVTCLDQPYAALDAASVQVIRDFLSDMADHSTRSWVVADYEADARLPWRHTVTLP